MAFDCAVPLKQLRELKLSGQAFQAQGLADFSPSHFKSMLPLLQKLTLSDICLDKMHPFPQLEQVDGLDLGMAIRWTERMLDNTASLQHLAGIVPESVCLKDVVHISASLSAVMAVQRHFSLHAAQSSAISAISQTPRCQSLLLNMYALPGLQVDWACLFQHATSVSLHGCVDIVNFNSLPNKPSWKFVMHRKSAWTLHWKARDFLQAGHHKGFYQQEYSSQMHRNYSCIIMTSSDAIDRLFESTVWSVM
jgi:hypothetical protein